MILVGHMLILHYYQLITILFVYFVSEKNTYFYLNCDGICLESRDHLSNQNQQQKTTRYLRYSILMVAAPPPQGKRKN